MRPLFLALRRLFVFFFALASAIAYAQECPTAPVIGNAHGFNMFTEEQESELGDIMAAREVSGLHVLELDEISGHLQKIVDRLVAQMPPTKLHFRAYVIDEPFNNAFTLPGGRIFVTKKMVLFTRSEDELAGVLAHELGHQVTHQMAYDWSKTFRDELGVTKLGDRADIEDKFHQYLEIYRKKEGNSSDRVENEQLGADQVAVYAMARAGYSPGAVVEFWDRFAETKGKKGNFFSDMFGSTLPDSKRLREFTKNLAALPATCVTTGRVADADFLSWQAAVKKYSGFGKKEELHNVAYRRPLEPSLRTDLHHLKFSPDGKYLLGQDDSSIFVMSVDPLANLFRIDSHDAYPAQFSPDSQSVVFYDRGLHVEKWSIAEKRVEDANEVHEILGCVQTALSPDGNVLACVIPNRETFFPLDLELFDVASGNPVLLKKSWTGPAAVSLSSYYSFLMVQSGRPVITMAFSPDGKYFIAGRRESHLMYDLTSRSEVPMSGDLKKYTAFNFAFVGPDKIVGVDSSEGTHGAMVKVPSGERTEADITIGPLSTYPAAKGDYVILRPIAKAPIGIMDLEKKRLFVASKTDAMDIYENRYVSERVNGEVALYSAKNAGTDPGLENRAGSEDRSKPIATLALPRSPIARVYAATLSPDMGSFVLSDRTRGAMWDLGSGNRILYVRGFRAAHFTDSALFLDFMPPDGFVALQSQDESEKDVRHREAEKPDQTLAKVDFEKRQMLDVASFKKRNHLFQGGSVMLVTTPEDDEHPTQKITVEARDFGTGATLWSRKLKQMPAIQGSANEDVVVFVWYLGEKGVKEELKDDPDAKKLVDNIKDNDGSYLVEVFDARKGTALGRFPVDSGRASFRIRTAHASAGQVLMTDNQGRVLLYSYKGERKGRLFGAFPSLSGDGSLLAIEPEPGRVAIYDVASMKKKDQFTFESRVAFNQFAADNHHLTVLTEDQTLYVLDVAKGDGTKTAMSNQPH